MIRDVQATDAQALCDIYNPYIESSIITFEEQRVTVAEMQHRIQETTKKWPWLVFEEDNEVLGYAYAGPWKDRSAFRYCTESSIYLAQPAIGKGIGNPLYTELIRQLTHLSFHSVIAGISLPNPASVAFHEKLGFEPIGHFKAVGWKLNQWVDVGYWELLLDKD